MITTYEFTLIVEGVDLIDGSDADRACDALYAALPDSTLASRDAVQFVHVDRDAADYPSALFAALEQVERAVPGLRVSRVEPDELAGLEALADAAGRTRESLRLLQLGKRGPGGFPAPTSVADRRLWRVREVADWSADRLGDATLRERLGDRIHVGEVNAAVNAVLALCRHRVELDPPVREKIRTLLGDALTAA